MRQNCLVLPQDVSKQRSDLHLLDVREQDEWDAGHIEGAQHIPLGELGARLAEVPREQVVVAVCRSGSRSDRAAKGLEMVAEGVRRIRTPFLDVALQVELGSQQLAFQQPSRLCTFAL